MSKSDSEGSSQSTPPRSAIKRKGFKVVQRFRNAWLKQDNFKYWVEPVKDDNLKARCKPCNSMMRADISVLKLHANSAKHIRHYKNVDKSKSMKDYLSKTNEDTELQVLIKKAEILIFAFLAEHNIPLRVVDHLQSVLKSSFVDSKIAEGLQLKRTKTTAILKNILGETEKNNLADKLKSSKFSILIDESTDIAAVKTMAIVVRFYDEDLGSVCSKIWELVQVGSPGNPETTAQNLFETVLSTFKAKNVPIENIIGFASDGANVMMGEWNSVASRFKQLCPGITVFKCICHSLNLCANEACKQLPRSCEELVRNLYNFFNCSSKRQSEFVQFQKFTDTEVHKLLHPAATRWLSLELVVGRTLEQWSALTLYFNEKWIEQKLIAAEQIHKYLNDPFLKLYFLFLKWVLPKFTKMNQYFQSEKIVLTDMHSSMTDMYSDLLCCFLDRTYICTSNLSSIDPCDETKFKPYSALYLGIDVLEGLKDPTIKARPDLIKHFYQRCLAFLSCACGQIKKRYNFDDPLLQKIAVLKPQRACSLQERDTTPSLLDFFGNLPRVIDHQQFQQIDNE